MSAIDISRHLHQPAKRYSGVVQLQGSVLLDAELNERDLIQEEGLRRLVTDFVCSRASPDDGFLVADFDDPAAYDFTITPGTLYLGGFRLEAGANERFRRQADWLQQPAVPAPAPPAVADLPRFDLVWIEAWEQAVTGTEDAEIVENALGGPHTSARLRPMRRVRVLTNVADNCPDAVDQLVAQEGGALDDRTLELVSDRRLTVGFSAAAAVADLCSPGTRSGYLGADNETIQVRVLAGDRFIWSYGNAAPLYRVVIVNGGAIEFDTPPRDQTLRPRTGDIVELVRRDFLLANGEFAGEGHGSFHPVTAAYNPETRQVTVGGAPIADDAAFAGRVTGLTGDPQAPSAGNYYARVWRGQSVDPAQTGIFFGPNGDIPLGDTGVTVRFTGDGPPGDYWTFSVRPHTPEEIIPWEMKRPGGVPPTGRKRHIAPLALVEWILEGGVPTPRIHDCRDRVRKLCQTDGCCEITVGDGRESHGDVNTLADAIALIPPGGGRICLLRGNHSVADARILGVTNVTIDGCGTLSVLRLDALATGPILTIGDSVNVRIRNLRIEAPQAIAISLYDSGSNGLEFGRLLRDVTLTAVTIVSRDFPAVVFDGGSGFAMESCTIHLDPLVGQLGDGDRGIGSAVMVLGADIRIECCVIAGAAETRRSLLPSGGIRVLGGSEDVEIRRNTIRHGHGTGIELGSVSERRAAAPPSFTPRVGFFLTELQRGQLDRWILPTRRIVVGADGCIKVTVTPRPPRPPGGDGGSDPVLEVDLPIRRLRIVDNEIMAMGGDGIGVASFFDLFKDEQIISVAELEIRDNRIRDCVFTGAASLADETGNPDDDGLVAWSARGGVVLGHVEGLSFEDNVIVDCGTETDDPVCGFFGVFVQDGRFEGNSIARNGRRAVEAQQLRLGNRGGIVIRTAMPTILPSRNPDNGLVVDRSAALLVAGNRVSAPEGRALQVAGIGAMSITGNQFASMGAASLSWRAIQLLSVEGRGIPSPPGADALHRANPLELAFGGAVVSVINQALASELLADGGLGAGLGLSFPLEPDGSVSGVLTNGKVLFNNNQTQFATSPRTPATAISGVFVYSLDDVQMCHNQCDADLQPKDRLVAHALVAATSLHMQDNRLSETYVRCRKDDDEANVDLSAFTIGLSNITTNNFGTHCIVARTRPPGVPISVLSPNFSWLSVNDPKACKASQDRAVTRILNAVIFSNQEAARWRHR